MYILIILLYMKNINMWGLVFHIFNFKILLIRSLIEKFNILLLNYLFLIQNANKYNAYHLVCPKSNFLIIFVSKQVSDQFQVHSFCKRLAAIILTFNFKIDLLGIDK